MDEQNENQEVEETDETTEVAEESSEETTDWEARAKELEVKAIKQREKTKELKAKLAELEAQKPKEKKTKQSDDFDNAQKALLTAYGYKDSDERDLIKSFMERTGEDDVEQIIKDDILIAKIEKLRDEKAVKNAIPTSKGRSANETKTAVDFWLGKPFNQVPREMRRDVLAARLKREEDKQKYGG